MEKDVIRFFEENINRYLMLFKLEYIKFINTLMNSDKKAALQPERNLTLVQDPANKNQQQKATPTKVPPKDEEKKSPSPTKDDSRDKLRDSDVDIRASTNSTVSTKSDAPNKNNETTLDYIPVLEVL